MFQIPVTAPDICSTQTQRTQGGAKVNSHSLFNTSLMARDFCKTLYKKTCFFTLLRHYCNSRPTVNYINHKSLQRLFETPWIGVILLVFHSWVTPTLWSHPSVSERFPTATQKLFCVGTSQLCTPTWGLSIDQLSCKVYRQSRRGKYREGQHTVNKNQPTLIISQRISWFEA